jgi:lysophospholipase L1-like esterase
LTTSSVIGTAPTGVPAPLDKYGITYPLQDKHLLIPSEITELQVATDAYNVTIASLASANDLAFVDANAKMQQLANGGVQSNGFNLTSALVFGNAFSLDGVHPTSRGYAFLANEFVKAINSKYGSNLPLVNIGNYNNLFSAQLP